MTKLHGFGFGHFEYEILKSEFIDTYVNESYNEKFKFCCKQLSLGIHYLPICSIDPYHFYIYIKFYAVHRLTILALETTTSWRIRGRGRSFLHRRGSPTSRAATVSSCRRTSASTNQGTPSNSGSSHWTSKGGGELSLLNVFI